MDEKGEQPISADQRAVLYRIHTVVAEALPVEGRDYVMDITFPDGNARNCRVSISGITEIGKSFARHLVPLVSGIGSSASTRYAEANALSDTTAGKDKDTAEAGIASKPKPYLPTAIRY